MGRAVTSVLQLTTAQAESMARARGGRLLPTKRIWYPDASRPTLITTILRWELATQVRVRLVVSGCADRQPNIGSSWRLTSSAGWTTAAAINPVWTKDGVTWTSEVLVDIPVGSSGQMLVLSVGVRTWNGLTIGDRIDFMAIGGALGALLMQFTSVLGAWTYRSTPVIVAGAWTVVGPEGRQARIQVRVRANCERAIYAGGVLLNDHTMQGGVYAGGTFDSYRMDLKRGGTTVETFWLNYAPGNTASSGVVWNLSFTVQAQVGDVLQFNNTPLDAITSGIPAPMPSAVDAVDLVTPIKYNATLYENAMQVDLIGMEWM